MKFVKIENNSNGETQQFTNLPLISNSQDLLRFLQKSKLSDTQYMQIYKLLFTTQRNYQTITQQYFENIDSLNQIASQSNFTINKYKLQQFKYNPDGDIQQNSTLVPQFVIQNTTLPIRTLFKNGLMKYKWDSIYFHTQSDYIENNLDGIVGEISKKYPNLQDENPCRFTMQVVQPPSNMVRYINKKLDTWQIVQLPQDFIETEINVNGDILQIFLSKKVTTYVDSQTNVSKSAVYPCVRNLQLTSLLYTSSTIRKLIDSFNNDDSALIDNVSQYVTSSGISNVVFDYTGTSKYLKTNYNQKTLKNINVQYFTLSNKLGYYNSLIPNQLVQDLRLYRYTNYNSYYSNLLTVQGRYDEDLFNNNQKSNILSLIYNKQTQNNKYGFLHQINTYKVTCDFRINSKRSNNEISHINIKDLYTNLQITNNKNYNQLFQILIYPFNGIQEMQQLLQNENIGVILPQNMYKRVNSLAALSHQFPQDIREIYNPCKTFHSLTDQQIYQDQQQIYRVYDYGKLSLKMLKPNKNYKDFNFMFNRYGQFLTYRTLDKRYYKFNQKPYKYIFADYNVSIQQLGEGWIRMTSLIDKKFQGNSILSFNLNQTWSDLLSSYKYEMIKLEIKNINLEVII